MFHKSKKIGFLAIFAIATAFFSLAFWLFSADEKTYAQQPVSKTQLADAIERPEAPDVHFLDSSNQRVSLAAFRGQVVILNFWASWCKHCVNELSDLVALEKRLNEANIPARVLFVNVDSSEQDARSFLKDKDLPIAFFHDNTSMAMHAFRSAFLPTTILIDMNGRVAKVIYGEASWDSQPVVDYIRHVAETSQS